MNSNIKIILIKTSLDGIVQSLFWYASGFIVYALNGNSTEFGIIAGIATLSSIIVSILASVLSDKLERRDFFIWFGHIFYFIGMVLISFAYTIGIVLWASIVVNASTQFITYNQITIVADSTISSEKNQIFSLIFLIDNLFAVVGAILGSITFALYGDSINITTLLIIFQIGMVLSLVELVLAFMIRDSKSLKTEKDKQQPIVIIPKTTISTNIKNIRQSFFSKQIFILPFLVVTAGCIIGLGAGTSIIFLQIFFIRYYNLDPAFLSGMFALMGLITAVWGKLMGNLADKIGRIKTIISTQLIATTLLYLLATYPPVLIALITLLVRNAFMNGSGPIRSALITDNVPKNFRARWIALQAAGWSFFYSLGNFIGGSLIDAYGFWAAFLVTATLYLIGTLLFVLIKEPTTQITRVIDNKNSAMIN